MKAINKLLVGFILLFSTSSLAGDLLFDSSFGDNEEGDNLQYNATANKWDYAGNDETLKYNALQDRWDYAGEDDSLKYNVFEDKWEYADDNDQLKYNPFEDEWEFAR
jgi:hypothetical protein